MRKLFSSSLGAALVALVILPIPARAATVSKTFGFTGPETFPIDYQISQIHAADINGDGLMDLVVVNNARSKITLLINQTGRTNLARTVTQGVKRELNELPPDARFRIDSIASEKRIAALVVADLNGDGRPDLAYYGEPKELIVQYNQGTNGWSAPKRFPIEDGQLSPNGLVTGDVNGDGRTDLLLLGEHHIYLLTQKADHTPAEPEKIPFTGTVKAVQVLDIDGDGRGDLLLANWDTANPFRIRLQNPSGQMGPEIHFAMPPVRSYWADDLDGDHKTEIVTISLNSGRAQISNITRKPAEKLAGNFSAGQFQIMPLGKTTRAKRGTVWADVNGDGRPDLLVAEPESGQLTIYLQQADGTLGAAKTFPSLTGVSDVAVAARDDSGRPEIFVLSGDERQVGVTHYDESGRVAFPKMIPLEGKPLAMAVGALDARSKPVLAVILDQDGKRALWTRSADGKSKTQKLGDNFKSNPVALAFHDLDQDGLTDLVVLIPYEKIKILRQVAGKDFQELDLAPPGGSVEQPWLASADVDGDSRPELLLAQKNFLRAVVLKAEAGAKDGADQNWTFIVKDQINGAANNSRIVGAASLRNGNNPVPSLFLLDAERKAVTFCERDTNGVWQVVRNLPLPFSEFNELRAVPLADPSPNAVAFLGLNAIGWMALQGATWEFTELDGYETPIKDAHLNDLVSGDLNQDGRKELVFMETAKNYLDLVIFDASRKLVPMNRWQVFEERTFRNRRSDFPEPREAVIADFTGDGKNDLIVLVHDRVLLYPQE